MITRDHGAEIFLEKDARKWAGRLVKHQMAIAEIQKQVKGLRSVTTAYTKVRREGGRREEGGKEE